MTPNEPKTSPRPLSEQELQELEQIRLEATDGYADMQAHWRTDGAKVVGRYGSYLTIAKCVHTRREYEHAKYIAAIHNAFPALLAEVKAGRERETLMGRVINERSKELANVSSQLSTALREREWATKAARDAIGERDKLQDRLTGEIDARAAAEDQRDAALRDLAATRESLLQCARLREEYQQERDEAREEREAALARGREYIAAGAHVAKQRDAYRAALEKIANGDQSARNLAACNRIARAALSAEVK